MKLIRFGDANHERPGVLLDDGRQIDVSEHFADYTPEFFASGGLEQLQSVVASGHRCNEVAQGVRLGPPIAKPGKFVAVGLNFHNHVKEVGLPMPKEPEMFTKYTTCICGPDDNVLIPRGSTRLDYELELAFVVKKKSRYLESAEQALDHIAGLTICNDVSERAFQFDHGSQFVKGKSADTFGPLGPWLVTLDSIPDMNNLKMSLSVNGEQRQNSNTGDMIFNVPHILWDLSQFFTFEPGDVVTTGTPEGVIAGMKPPVWLKAGDVIQMEIEGLGTQTQTVTALPENY